MLADDLAVALARQPSLTAADLAPMVGETERMVSFVLLGEHRRFRCATGPPRRWHLTPAPGRPAPPAPAVVASGSSTAPGPSGTTSLPAAGPLPAAGLRLYPWQVDALAAWGRAGRRGVVEAVTGTGKTMVGVAATLAEVERRGQVLALVPTVELAQQWVVEMVARLPGGVRVGLLGAGRADSLTTHDVLVAVVNSARAIDVRPIRPGGLLVADECHRYGSSANHLALDDRFGRRLGLSATYARDDDGNLAWLDPYFGGTCFQLGYQRARADGVTARFTVALVGVRLSPAEQAIYAELSEAMGALRARLIRRHGLAAEPFEAFMRAVNSLADGDGDGAGVARAWRQAMLERRRLLAETPAKAAAVAGLAPAVADADRAIVFTQSIPASERACGVLAAAGLRAGVVHSGLGRDERRSVLDRFGAGDLDVVAAPRVLDEGIDVPTADLGVIAGASRSRRQMIQRMGRVLRRKPDGRRARFAVLFVEGTVEDPACGAHEAFLDEIVDVADRLAAFPADRSAREGDAPAGGAPAGCAALRDALRPSWA